MHHMSGKELSDRLRILYPQTKILFTSAYTENAMVHQGVLNPGVTLLQKPFTPRALACKVREVLDQPAAPKPDTARKAFAFTHKAPLRQPQSNTRHEKTDPESGIDDAYARGDAHRALFPQRIGRQDNYLSFGQRGPGLAAGEHRAGRHPALRLPLLAGRGTGSGSFLVHG
jgi:CheY-like chemotaxis protein